MSNVRSIDRGKITCQVPAEFIIESCPEGKNYLIGGEVITSRVPGMKVVSPVSVPQNGQWHSITLGETACLDQNEARRALQTAEAAYDGGRGVWPGMTVAERVEAMEAFAWRMRSLERRFSILEMWEIGKPFPACRDEFKRTLDYIEDTVKSLQAMEHESNDIKRQDDYIYQVRRCPLGVVLVMGPFNYPLNETFAMAVPALMMGNCVIIKPPRYGALCTTLLLESFAASFPPGVVNVINGDGATIIDPIIESGRIQALGFTGSSKTARLLIQKHPANNRLRTILGLEAKNPAFVFADADLELAVRECLNGALEFNGQRCTALKHIWVHSDIAERFLELISREIEKIRCGFPWEPDVVVTPLAEEDKCSWLHELVDECLAQGANIINPSGGKVEGNLFYPTILYPVKDTMQIYGVEQFGPVIPVSSFSDLHELSAYLLHSDYGQQASIFTASPQNAAPLIDILANQVSRINLNAQCRRSPDELPFTGRKDSGEGTLSVTDALRSFSIRSLAVANDQGRELFFRTLESGLSKFLKI